MEYVNLSASFDIEATSFKWRGQKRGTMYAFVFGINGKVVFGRSWEDFREVIKAVCVSYGLGAERRLPVYVHNLSYEFQWIRHLFEWEDV
ncbi:MAG: hypothetical protein IIY58_00175, partial [Aeriscardovia sp.]|nr:hypothetical protein [Aeriscardovia sp.]